MAKRNWRVGPDSIYELPSGEQVYYVSREAQANALLDGLVFLERSGGSLTVTVGRQPTELPGEALTTGMIVQWLSGPRARTEPEAPVVVPVPQAAPAPAPEPEPVDEFAAESDDQPIIDGLDESTLPEEDDSAVPAELR